MKLIVLWLNIFINIKLLLTYHSGQKSSIIERMDELNSPRFVQKNLLNNNNNLNSNSEITNMVNFKSYSTNLYIFKDLDTTEDKPTYLKSKIKFSDSIEIYEGEKLIRKISFTK